MTWLGAVVQLIVQFPFAWRSDRREASRRCVELGMDFVDVRRERYETAPLSERTQYFDEYRDALELADVLVLHELWQLAPGILAGLHTTPNRVDAVHREDVEVTDRALP